MRPDMCGDKPDVWGTVRCPFSLQSTTIHQKYNALSAKVALMIQDVWYWLSILTCVRSCL
jgi:hypothetical protein